MYRPWMLLMLPIAACGGPEDVDPFSSPCSGLQVDLMDSAIAPPANVAALVRISDCDGAPLGVQLPAASFALTEDGREPADFEGAYKVRIAEAQSATNVAIVLDLSGSIVRGGLRDAMIDGARSLVKGLPGRHAIGVYGFDGRPELVRFSGFTENRDATVEALEAARGVEVVDDSTNLHGAIVGALDVLDEATGPGAMVLFTDGDDRAARVSSSEVDERLDETSHLTFAIGLGTDLEDYGRHGSAYAEDADAIADAFDAITAGLRAYTEATYVVSHCSPARAGSHVLDISVSLDDRTGSTELEFDAEGFGAGCDPSNPPM